MWLHIRSREPNLQGWAATESLQPLMPTFALFPTIQTRLIRRILKRRINFTLGTNNIGQRYNPKMVLSAGKAATSHSAGNTLGCSLLLLLEVFHKPSCNQTVIPKRGLETESGGSNRLNTSLTLGDWGLFTWPGCPRYLLLRQTGTYLLT